MLAGSLTEFSIPDVFSLLALTRKTGLLHLTGPEADGRVWIIGGALAYAVADVTRTPLAARLLHGGEISTDAVESLVQAQASGDATQVAAALTAAGLSTDRVHQLLHDQIVDAVFDLARWHEGSFSFDAAPAAVDGSVPLVPVTEVLEAVTARIAEWDGIVAQLPSPASVLAPVSRPPLHSGGMVQISPAQWEVLTLVDGLRSVNDIIALTGQGPFVVARLLASMVADGIVAVADQPGGRTLSQQRATHLARLEQQLLGASAQEVPTAVAGPAPQTEQAQTPHGASDSEEPAAAEAAATPAGDTTPDVAPEAALESEDVAGHHDGADEDDSPEEPEEHTPEDATAEDRTAEDRTPEDRTPEDLPEDLEAEDEGEHHADAATSSELAERRRAREMAAVGMGSVESGQVPAPAPHPETKSLGSDLLARLIDGVKGA